MIPPRIQTLFDGPPDAPSREVPLRLLRRGGEPFLFVPREPRLAAIALDLYPAQTWAARLARGCLRAAWSMGVALPFGSVALRAAEGSPLGRFFVELEGGAWPLFALLAGNPRAGGQRFIFLLFDRSSGPRWVVKVGASPEARALIAAEIRVFKSLPANTPGVPVVRAEFAAGEIAAFALDFVPGDSPRVSFDDPSLATLMTSWLDQTVEATLAGLNVWQRLRAVAPDEAATLEQAAAGRSFHPTIFHGDFAPWNVKVQRGAWTVLDWERGELIGPPAWDWFHFVVQTAVLVEHCNAAAAWKKLGALLDSPAFASYARRAGIVGLERTLASAYLLYCARVLQPSEARMVFRDLGQLALTARR